MNELTHNDDYDYDYDYYYADDDDDYHHHSDDGDGEIHMRTTLTNQTVPLTECTFVKYSLCEWKK